MKKEDKETLEGMKNFANWFFDIKELVRDIKQDSEENKKRHEEVVLLSKRMVSLTRVIAFLTVVLSVIGFVGVAFQVVSITSGQLTGFGAVVVGLGAGFAGATFAFLLARLFAPDLFKI